jgi:hypothetical protein
MASAVITATLGQALASGAYNSSAAAVGDSAASLNTAITAAVDAAALVTADPTVAGDPTALGLAEDTDAALAAVVAAQAAIETGDMTLIVDMAVVTDRNKFRSALRAIEQAAFGGTV